MKRKIAISLLAIMCIMAVGVNTPDVHAKEIVSYERYEPKPVLCLCGGTSSYTDYYNGRLVTRCSSCGAILSYK